MKDTKMQILVTVPQGILHGALFGDEVRRMLLDVGSVTWNESDQNWSHEELAPRLAGVDAVLTTWGTPTFTADLLEHANRLRFIGHCAGSVANVVSEAVYDREIVVSSANDQMAKGVAEYNLAVMLMGVRLLWIFNRRVTDEGGWLPRDERLQRVRRLDGCTVGIIGYGAIARELIRLLAPFRVRALVHSSHVSADAARSLGIENVPIEALLGESDVIHVLTSLRADTHRMLNAERLALIRDNALLINSGRGKIIDEAALIEELEAERFYAVLDVYEREPLPDDSPLRRLPNVFVTPHMGGAGGEPHYAELIADDLACMARDEPVPHAVSREQWRNMTDQTVGRGIGHKR